MATHRITSLAVIGALALGLTAAAPEPSLDHLTPQDKALLHFNPGEWQFTIAGAKTAASKICFDASLAERYVDIGRMVAEVRCDKAVVTKTGDGFTLHSVCAAYTGETVTTDVVRHVTDAAHFTQHATVVGTRHKTPVSTNTLDTKAVRIGACPPSARPGDMKTEGSDRKVNLNDWMQPAPVDPPVPPLRAPPPAKPAS